MESKNRFLLRNPQKGDLNQYWYSARTIDFIVNEVERNATKAAFLSCPSVFFSLKNDELKKRSIVFDFDTKWEKEEQFRKYDFHHPTEIDPELQHKFDFIVIDPPFITRDVWELYGESAKFLAKRNEEDGIMEAKILLSTISENEEMMEELLGVKKCEFKPSIPDLVYQYCFYANYDSESLSSKNDEIPE